MRTDVMVEGNVYEYDLISYMAQPTLESYIGLLARSYGRFKVFKEREATDGDDTALDAALDIMHYTIEYTDETIGPLPEDASDTEKLERARQVVRTWQRIVAGTTRYNPITGEPMVADTRPTHFTLMEMWRHETGEEAGNLELWGVSGFHPHFVGDEANINQVEHMSISMFIQFVDREPWVVLNLEEDKELLTGHSTSKEMAEADMALNRAVATEFLPDFAADMHGTVERMRCYLKRECA